MEHKKPKNENQKTRYDIKHYNLRPQTLVFLGSVSRLKLCSHMQLLPVISLPGISPMQLKFFRWSTNASTLVGISTYTW